MVSEGGVLVGVQRGIHPPVDKTLASCLYTGLRCQTDHQRMATGTVTNSMVLLELMWVPPHTRTSFSLIILSCIREARCSVVLVGTGPQFGLRPSYRTSSRGSSMDTQ